MAFVVNTEDLPEDVSWNIRRESVTLCKEGEVFAHSVDSEITPDSIEISKEHLWKFIKNLAAYEAKNDKNEVLPEGVEIEIKQSNSN